MADPGLPMPALEYVPRDDEKTMATLAHILQLIGWWIAPLVIFLVKRDSKFVSFHAVQALFLQIAYMALWMIGMVVFFAVIFASAVNGNLPKNGPPPPFFAFFPLLWLVGMALWALMLVAAIVYGIKAGRGEWAEYPVIGPIAKRIVLQ